MSRSKHRSTKPFVHLEHQLVDSPAYHRLSNNARALLIALVRQYRGSNNGDLSMTLKMARERNLFRSDKPLRGALRELESSGIIVKTRQGGKNRCCLYALTSKPINYCDGKHDMKATHVASYDWKRVS